MTSITNTKGYTIAFTFYEIDTIEKNQKAAGNNLFEPIRQTYGDRLVESKYITDKMNRMGHHVYDRDMVIIFWFHARRPMNSAQRRLARRDRVFAPLGDYYGSTLLPIAWRGSELYITIRDCVAVRATLPELMSVLERIRLFQYFELCGIIAFDHNDGELTENIRYDRDGVALLFRLDRELRMYRELNPFNYQISD
ncbi:hypothetical protein FCIRC_900 [Fusarium circinatum]|uniref:Uncharacterized protein n=1 Tax=Fusarium circinatum TaxID=48490 RepID=A0A8H5UM72_FUSCI|nr:hypothetical protein FCIRC_900 [Fusarium circinatum]